MKAKIKAIQGSGTFESKFGLLYKFEYQFEDGVILTANHKTQQSPFKVGDEVEYEIKMENENGRIGSVKKPEGQVPFSAQKNGRENSYTQILSFSMSYAKDLACAEVIKVQDISNYADLILEWFKKNQ